MAFLLAALLAVPQARQAPEGPPLFTVDADVDKQEGVLREGKVEFSPDLTRWVYWAGSRLKFVGNVEGLPAGAVGSGQVHPFTADQRAVYSWAEEKKGRYLRIGDSTFGPYAFIGSLQFSDDGKSHAFAAVTAGGKGFVVHNGTKQKEHDAVERLVLSRDGKKIAYVAKAGTVPGLEKYHAIHGTAAGPAFAEISQLCMTPDGKTVAYAAARMRGRPPVLLVGGKESEIGALALTSLAISPDGRETSALLPGVEGGILVQGKLRTPLGPTLSVNRHGYSPDGKPWALLMDRSDRVKPVFWIVWNGNVEGRSEETREPWFTADGAFRIVHGVHRMPAGESREFVLINGSESPWAKLWRLPVVSPDGKTAGLCAYRAADPKRSGWYAAAGAAESGPWGWVARVAFSADGKSLDYVARHELGVWRLSLPLGP